MKLLVLILACCVGSAPWAQERHVAGVAMPAPWPAGDSADTHWGMRVSDPYRALENVKDPAVQSWLRAHADATHAVMAKLPGRAELLARIQALQAEASGTASSFQRSDDGRLFFLRTNPGEQQARLMLREGLTADPAKDRVLVDPDALSKAAGRPVALLGYSASPDGKKMAYALQTGGGEIGSMQVVDVDSGRVLVAPVDRIRGFSASWLDDSTGFFYNRLREGYEAMPPTERFQDNTTFFLTLDGTNRAVFSSSLRGELKLPSIASAYMIPVRGQAMVLAWVALGVDRNGLLFMADMQDAQAGRARWRKLVDGTDAVSQMALGQHRGKPVVYLRSAKGAPRFQVLRLALERGEMAQAEVVVPHGDGVITSLSGARDALYLTRRVGVNTALWRLPHDGGALEAVALSQAGTVAVRQVDSAQDGVVARVSSWTQAGADYRWDPARKTATPLVLAHVGRFDAPAGISAREVMVRSHDGVMVPASIVSRSDLKLDGSNPTILYGYGAYGTVESPGFSATRLAWLERGGIYVFAHVRGGGVFGDAWYRAGHKTTKPNTWKDGIAVAEWLIANGYTSAQKLGVYGGSAGGIFVGRAITERPDLFAAAVPAVPVLDTVRSELRANGVANVPEYGSVKKEDEFRGLLAMSSYNALKERGQYPAVMLTHGVNDIRVDVWQSAKFAARLEASGTDKPVLMLLDYEAGHGGGSSRLQAQERQASMWAFFLWQFGVKGFQPTPAS